MATRLSTESATATVANTINSPSHVMQSKYSAWVVYVCHTGDIASNPVTDVNYAGTDSGFFVAAQNTGLGNACIECWMIFPVTATSGSVTANFDIASSLTIILFAREINWFGGHGPAAELDNTSGAAATSTSNTITVSDTTGGPLPGRSVAVPASSALIHGGCLLYSASQTPSVTAGTSEGSITAGSAGNRLAACFAYMQATGSADTLSYSFGSSEFGALMTASLANPLLGILKNDQILPQVNPA